MRHFIIILFFHSFIFSYCFRPRFTNKFTLFYKDEKITIFIWNHQLKSPFRCPIIRKCLYCSCKKNSHRFLHGQTVIFYRTLTWCTLHKICIKIDLFEPEISAISDPWERAKRWCWTSSSSSSCNFRRIRHLNYLHDNQQSMLFRDEISRIWISIYTIRL